AIACLSLPDIEVLHEWEGRPSGTEALAFDGRLAIYARLDSPSHVSIRRLADDQEIYDFTTSIKQPGLLLSPDGRFLRLETNFAQSGPMEVWRLTGTKPVRCLAAPSAFVQFTAFSQDSRRLAYLRSDDTMVVHDLTSGPIGQWRLPGRRMEFALAF